MVKFAVLMKVWRAVTLLRSVRTGWFLRRSRIRSLGSLLLAGALGAAIVTASISRAAQGPSEAPLGNGQEPGRGKTGTATGIQKSGIQGAGLPTGTEIPFPTGGMEPVVYPNQREGGSSTEPVGVIIEMDDRPAVELFARAGADPALKAEAAAATRNQISRIDDAQQTLLLRLARQGIASTLLYRSQRVYNGVALQVDAAKLDEIRRMPGVRAVHPLVPLSLDANASTRFIGSVAAWSSPTRLHGEGIRIAIIDSGVDYLHADFGGAAGYAGNDTSVVGDIAGFPSAKVVGGFDFVGDTYNASQSANRVPRPDPDPMDCGGHGTGVAGVAAGFGVNPDGSAFGGPYDATTPFHSLRIQPGVAPLATLYAYKIFGCSGTTEVLIAAIERAVDPNQDGDLSDHLDVINMSVGAEFGLPLDPEATAANNAALAGVIVVASAGNSGDTHYITGGPGTAERVVSVAASVDDGLSFSGIDVTAPASVAGRYRASVARFGPAMPSTPLAGTLVAAVPADGCADLSNAAAVAGRIALIDRGTCNFVNKVRAAQRAGALAVLIANNVESPLPPVPVDDGTGSDIAIPSVGVTLSDGARLRAQLSNSVTVRLASDIAVQAPEEADTLTSFSSRGPARLTSALKPDIAAPGESDITTARARTGSQADDAFNGTSAAAPHVAGAMGLLRQLHPSWSVEELKALAMNSATHDLFAGANSQPPRHNPSRIGAGRVDLSQAASLNVVAYGTDNPGQVGISFGSVEADEAVTRTRTVRVVNKGVAAAAFDLAYDPVLDAPGVEISFPGGTSLTVPAGGSTTFQVQLRAIPSQMRHVRDPLSSERIGSSPRHWLTEESGFVRLSSAGTLLRVPLHAVPRPASRMRSAQTSLRLDQPSGTLSLSLTGTGVATGSSTPVDVVSLGTPFELQASSPNESSTPAWLDSSDLQYAGVKSDFRVQAAAGRGVADSTLYFGVAMHGNWTSINHSEVDVLIDTDRDGVNDFVLFTGSTANPQSAASDTFAAFLVDLKTGNRLAATFLNAYHAGEYDTAVFNNNVLFIPVRASALGLNASRSRFNYQIRTYRLYSFALLGSQPLDTLGPLTYDVASPGLDFGENLSFFDREGNTIPVRYDRTAYADSASQGVLLLHHHNLSGAHAEVVSVLTGQEAADLSITKAASASSVTAGANFQYTLGVLNQGPSGAAGVTASDTLAGSLSFVSASASQGSCSLSGSVVTCSLGDLASGAAASVTLTVSATSAGSITNTASVSGSTTDPVASNNAASASVTVSLPSADLSITKTAAPNPAVAGSPLTYTLRVSNAGPAVATGVRISDPLPSGTVFVSATATQGNCGQAGGTLTCNLGNLASGSSASVTLVVTPTAASTVGNTASVTGNEPDSNSSNNSASVQTAVTAATGNRLYFAHFGNGALPGAQLFSQILLFNLDTSQAVNARVFLRDDAGTPLSLRLNGEAVSGEKSLTVAPGGLQVLKTDGAGPILTGSVLVTSDRPLSGVILFGGSIGLDGVGASELLADGFVAPVETSASQRINTGIAMMNLEDRAVTVDLQLVDPDGTLLATARMDGAQSLPASGHTAHFVDEFAWSPPVNFASFSGMLRANVSGRIAATILQTRPGEFATVPVTSRTGLAKDGSAAPEVLPLTPSIRTTLAAPQVASERSPAAAGDGNLYFAHLVSGSAGATQIVSQILLFNLDSQRAASARLSLRDDNGLPLGLTLNGESVSGQKDVTVPPGGMRSLRTAAVGALSAGSVAVTSDRPLAGVVIFGGTIGVAGVSSGEALDGGFVAPIESNVSGGIRTGIAIMNLESRDVSADLTLFSSGGARLATARLDGRDALKGFGHLARFVEEFAWTPIVDFSTFTGLLKMTPNGRIAANVIQVRPNQFATMPVAAVASSPASNPVPAVSSLDPASASAGSGALTLTVNGSNFVSGSIVRWNGSNRPTTFGSSTRLTASITSSDLAPAGSATVTVFNPTPGGGTSNSVSFSLLPAASGSPPTIREVQVTRVSIFGRDTLEVDLNLSDPDADMERVDMEWFIGNSRAAASVSPAPSEARISGVTQGLRTFLFNSSDLGVDVTTLNAVEAVVTDSKGNKSAKSRVTF